MTWAGVTIPIDCWAVSTPPIVKDELRMSVCGGFTTCWIVWAGIVTVSLLLRNLSGRHLLNAASSRWPDCCAACTQAWIWLCSAAVSGAVDWLTVIVWAATFSSATILGTVPSWCTTCRVRPVDTWATPGMSLTWSAIPAGRTASPEGRKKSCTK